VDSFDYLKDRGYTVRSWEVLEPNASSTTGCCSENNVQLEYSKERRFPRFVYTLYNRGVRLLGGKRGKRVMSWLVGADELASRSTRDYAGSCA